MPKYFHVSDKKHPNKHILVPSRQNPTHQFFCMTKTNSRAIWAIFLSIWGVCKLGIQIKSWYTLVSVKK